MTGGRLTPAGGSPDAAELLLLVERLRVDAVAVVTALDELARLLDGAGGQGGDRRLTATWVRTPPTYLTAVLTPDEVRARLRPDAPSGEGGAGASSDPGPVLPVDTATDPAQLAGRDRPDPGSRK